MLFRTKISCAVLAVFIAAGGSASAQVAIRAKTVYTMQADGSGKYKTITDGVVVLQDGKVKEVGPQAEVTIPSGFKVLDAAVVTPGLIDGRATVGLSGIFNQKQDQDMLERSSPVQPELRAIDAYNPLDPLVEWVRSFGVTTVHTGHAPGELVSGQTCIVKTAGNTVEEAMVKEIAMVAATLGPGAQRGGKDSPGTRAKMVAMLRQELIKAQEYQDKRDRAAKRAADGKPAPADHDANDPEGSKKREPDRDLKREMLVAVLSGQAPLLVTANRAQDIDAVLRIKREFPGVKVVLDMASESYLLVDQIKAAGVPVIIHPTMFRMFGEMENMSIETASKLVHAGVLVAMQSSYEAYVPKTRVVLFEAGVAAANGLTFDEALATVTIGAAKLLGVDDRLGSLEAGKDGDVAMYDGDPFEYTTHCIGVVINGKVVSELKR
jgi:imidazolonepropionase-like amidohydrolase